MKTWQKQLASSLKSAVAQNYIARLNQEEDDFKTMTRFSAQDKQLRAMDNAGYLFARQLDRRPDVKYIDALRWTKAMTKTVERIMQEGGDVWCGIEHLNSGATCVLLKMGEVWVTVYEDGTTNRGVMPMLRYTWPDKLKREKRVAPVKFETNDLGGRVFNRYGV
jgi:hypothetical protein